jgi:hypothetical protein
MTTTRPHFTFRVDRSLSLTPRSEVAPGQIGKHLIILRLSASDLERLEAWYHPPIA